MIHKIILNTALKRLREIKGQMNMSSEDININRCNFCITIIAKMERDYDLLGKELCPYSYLHFGEALAKALEKFSSVSNEMYINCAKFTREMILYYERIKDVPADLEREWDNFLNDHSLLNDTFYNIERDILINGRFDIDVINSYLGNRSFQAFLNYEEKVKEAEEKLNLIDSNIKSRTGRLESFLSEKEEKVDILAEKLEEQKTAFNFVGLSQGFESLLKKKRDSQLIVLSLLFFIGIFLFIPLFTYVEINQIRNQSSDLFDWRIFLPFVSIELISLYLFRVVLTHYNSIKTQIMQLELRQTLCQFIQSYVEYAKEIKEKDSASLEKFENLIFSSILSTPDKVPSTFDGLEQLSNFIKNIKSGN